MDTQPDQPERQCKTSPAEWLNRSCFCKTLDRESLDTTLKMDELSKDVLLTHPQLFSNTAVFISPTQLMQMSALVSAVERVARLPAWQQCVLAQADATATFNAGTSGVFMGYDFHLSSAGPQVIEINTNAGGAFLNSALVSAQASCCREYENFLPLQGASAEEQFIAMFLKEWHYKSGGARLTCVAIVDENPQQQYLHVEFKMAQRLFERHGIKTIIVDPRDLLFESDQLSCHGQAIDLVYNRLTDFSLRDINNAQLRSAYLQSKVVLTPDPRHHRLYADKRNLALLTDSTVLSTLGVSEEDISILSKAIPHTEVVSPQNADRLWQERKHLFFKPATGFGSRAAYRGDKLTRRVWNEIASGDYVAQQLVPPSERGIMVDEQKVALKMDIRAYVYEGKIQLLAARLYQGQTTNFRTQGGGFAPVFIAG